MQIKYNKNNFHPVIQELCLDRFPRSSKKCAYFAVTWQKNTSMTFAKLIINFFGFYGQFSKNLSIVNKLNRKFQRNFSKTTKINEKEQKVRVKLCMVYIVLQLYYKKFNQK